MTAKFSSSFDDLLNTGKRQFDELAGKPVAPTARPADPAPAKAPTAGSVIEGTAGGVPFRLNPK